MACAAPTGQGLLRDMQGTCDLCGEDCYPNDEMCTALSCGFSGCDCDIYHQACIEKFLKAHRLPMDRKAGFFCPRGFSKSSKSTERCKGRIDKSHPIIPKNAKKVKAKAAAPQVLAAQQAALLAQRAERAKQTQAQQAAAAARKKLQQQQQQAAPRPHLPPAVTARGPPTEPSETSEDADERAASRELPPGMTPEMALTKAQRKNQRKKAKARTAETGSEAGTAVTEDSAAGGGDGAALEPWGAGWDARAAAALAAGGGGTNASAFVRDVDAYNRLLGHYLESSDEEEEEEEEAGGEEAGDFYGGASGSGSGGFAGSLGGGSGALSEAPAYDTPAATAAAPALRAPAPLGPGGGESTLPPGVTPANAAERLVSRMFDSPAFADVAVQFLEGPARGDLVAIAEAEYPALCVAIARGDVERFMSLVEKARPGRAAPAAPAFGAFDAPPPATVYAAADLSAPAPAFAPAPAALPPVYTAPAPPVDAAPPAPTAVYTAPAPPAPAVFAPAPAAAAAAYPVPAAPLPAYTPLPAALASLSLGGAKGDGLKGGAGDGEEASDDLDDLLALCGVEA